MKLTPKPGAIANRNECLGYQGYLPLIHVFQSGHSYSKSSK
jgi:hypothetical protein